MTARKHADATAQRHISQKESGGRKKEKLSAQHCQAVDETRLGAEETVCEDERDVVEEPDLMRASAC